MRKLLIFKCCSIYSCSNLRISDYGAHQSFELSSKLNNISCEMSKASKSINMSEDIFVDITFELLWYLLILLYFCGRLPCSQYTCTFMVVCIMFLVLLKKGLVACQEFDKISLLRLLLPKSLSKLEF